MFYILTKQAQATFWFFPDQYEIMKTACTLSVSYV